MSISRISSLFAATVLAGGITLAPATAAFADGVQDCTNQAEAAGMKGPDAGLACSYAKGGDTADCQSMVKTDSTVGTDEAASDTCGKAAPPPAPASP
jgi:hypothetical protein